MQRTAYPAIFTLLIQLSRAAQQFIARGLRDERVEAGVVLVDLSEIRLDDGDSGEAAVGEELPKLDGVGGLGVER